MEMIRVETNSPKSERESALVEFAQAVKKATVGISELTEAETKNLVDKLGKSAGLSPEDKTVLLDQLQTRISRSQAVLQASVQKATTTAVNDMVTAMEAELKRLEARLNRLTSAYRSH